jgi:hypothetical protein
MTALVSAAEYYENIGGANTDDYLIALYGDLLGRAPDSTGFDGFGTLLDAGAPRSVIAYALLNSIEFRANLVDQRLPASAPSRSRSRRAQLLRLDAGLWRERRERHRLPRRLGRVLQPRARLTGADHGHHERARRAER